MMLLLQAAPGIDARLRMMIRIDRRCTVSCRSRQPDPYRLSDWQWSSREYICACRTCTMSCKMSWDRALACQMILMRTISWESWMHWRMSWPWSQKIPLQAAYRPTCRYCTTSYLPRLPDTAGLTMTWRHPYFCHHVLFCACILALSAWPVCFCYVSWLSPAVAALSSTQWGAVADRCFATCVCTHEGDTDIGM